MYKRYLLFQIFQEKKKYYREILPFVSTKREPDTLKRVAFQNRSIV